jgi:hypothetical protein
MGSSQTRVDAWHLGPSFVSRIYPRLCSWNRRQVLRWN